MMSKGYIKHSIERFMLEGDKVAFYFYDGKAVNIITYREFVNDILKVAGYFVQNNITRQHVALVEQNSYEWIVTFFAVISTGNVAVLLDSLLPVEIIKKQCKLADVTYIYNTKNKFETTQIKGKILKGNFLESDLSIMMEEIYEESECDTIVLIATSGTTGESKLVEITSKNIAYSIYSAKKAYSRPGREKVMASFPYCHIGGVVDVYSSLYWAKSICLGRGMKHLFADMAILNPTYVSMVPAVLESLEKIFRITKSIDDRKKYVGDSLQRILVAGASLKESVRDFFLEQGFILETAYGMTETTGSTTWSEQSKERVGTIGEKSGEIQIKFVDGELLVKGPTIMKGYFKDPDATNYIIEEGWLHTGDLGYCDDEGYYYLTGRKKNVIILSNGENVNPEEIEAVFYKCDKIIEVMIYSDEKGICADIFTKSEGIAKAYVKSYNDSMPLYRQVYKVRYTNAPLEKTATGKIKRRENVYAK